MKIAIVYQSRRGKTAAYARAIAMYLWQQGVSVSLCATSDFKKEKLAECDGLMVGCWTSGWFIVNQHPNPLWVKFAEENLQGTLPAKLLLFTTYKIHTGSLFRRMKKRMNLSHVKSIQTLRSKTGFLTDQDKKELIDFINPST